jgi:hypothetical protein
MRRIHGNIFFITKWCRKITAFSTEYGRFWFNKLPMGLKGAAEAFQRRMDELMEIEPSLKGKHMETYQDDSLIFDDSIEDHALHIYMWLERLYYANVIPAWSKCVVGVEELEWCGRIISKDGIKCLTSKASAILKIAEPQSYAEAKTFYHMSAWHREFLPMFADTAKPIRSRWHGARNAKSPSINLKGIYMTRRNYTEMVQVYIIYIVMGPRDKLMGYYSKSLSNSEMNYGPAKIELYSMWLCYKHWRHLILGRKVVIFTDAKGYKDLNLNNLELQPEVQHIKGEDNIVADALTRLRIDNKDESAFVIHLEDSEAKRLCFKEAHEGP